MKRLTHKFLAVTALALFGCQSALLSTDRARPWNRAEYESFPQKAPFSATFRQGPLWLEYVADRHSEPEKTQTLVEAAISRAQPEIVIVESLEFAEGLDPDSWRRTYLRQSKEELYQASWAGPKAARSASQAGIPFIGGEPTLTEELRSEFLRDQGFTEEDILNTRLVRGIPFQRDQRRLRDLKVYLEYFRKKQGLPQSVEDLQLSLLSWYEQKQRRFFSYEKVTAEETAVNCQPTDTWMQKLSCQLNVHRDRYLLGVLNQLLKSHRRVLIVYGAGHFVQQLPSLREAFGEPVYRRP